MSYVLVVEPDDSQRSIYRSLCLDAGVECVEARDGVQARQLLDARGLPRLMVTELNLPRIDGFGLIRELRARQTGAQVPVLAISGIRALRDEAVRRKEELGIGTLLSRNAPVVSIQRALRGLLVLPAEHRPGHAHPAAPAAPRGSAVPRGSAWTRPVAEAPTVPLAARDPEAEREQRRLGRIAAMGLVDQLPPDEWLQRLVKEVAECFRVPVALVSLVLSDRQWFKAYYGLSGELLEKRGTPRDISFCRHIVENDQPLVVPDARVHPYFARNPLVLDGHVRGYAGVPLKAAGGEVLGTLCIVDREPLGVSAEDLELLGALARRVAGELELRERADRAAGEAARRGQEVALLQAVTEHLEHGVMLSDAGRQVLYASSALSDLTGVPLEEIANRGRDEWIAKFARRLADPAGAWRRLQAEAGGPFVAREDLELVLPERRWVRWTSKPVVIGGRWAQLCTFADVTAERELEARREALALIDELTLLPNRRAAEEALAREAARAGRWAIPVGLAMFEVGDLEEIAQAHGPGRAEALLSFLANLLGNTVRAGDLLCRWDAGRFLAVLTGIDLEGARAVVERAQAAVRTKVDPALPPATLSAAVGQLVAEEPPWVAVERLACELDQAARARAAAPAA